MSVFLIGCLGLIFQLFFYYKNIKIYNINIVLYGFLLPIYFFSSCLLGCVDFYFIDILFCYIVIFTLVFLFSFFLPFFSGDACEDCLLFALNFCKSDILLLALPILTINYGIELSFFLFVCAFLHDFFINIVFMVLQKNNRLFNSFFRKYQPLLLSCFLGFVLSFCNLNDNVNLFFLNLSEWSIIFILFCYLCLLNDGDAKNLIKSGVKYFLYKLLVVCFLLLAALYNGIVDFDIFFILFVLLLSPSYKYFYLSCNDTIKDFIIFKPAFFMVLTLYCLTC